MFESVKAIFFDVVGTLCFCPLMEEEYPRRLIELIAMTHKVDLTQAEDMLAKANRKLKGSAKHVTKVRVMKELGFTRSQVHDAFCKVNPRKYLSKDPDIISFISALASHYELGIISNFRHSYIKEIFDVLGLSKNFFRWIVSEDIVREVKPALEPFSKAVELSGIRADQCLYVGDSPTKDMQPAKEVGMATVLVSRNPTKDDLTYADSAIGDVKQLVRLLPRMQGY